MAIIIEEEKKSFNWVAVLSTLIIVAVVFVGSYFLFFTKPELIEVVIPGELQNLSKISSISFDVESVIASQTFKLLRKSSDDVTPGAPGKNNPFKPF